MWQLAMLAKQVDLCRSQQVQEVLLVARFSYLLVMLLAKSRQPEALLHSTAAHPRLEVAHYP
jgi:hypothetical protein